VSRSKGIGLVNWKCFGGEELFSSKRLNICEFVEENILMLSMWKGFRKVIKKVQSDRMRKRVVG